MPLSVCSILGRLFLYVVFHCLYIVCCIVLQWKCCLNYCEVHMCRSDDMLNSIVQGVNTLFKIPCVQQQVARNMCTSVRVQLHLLTNV